MDQVTEKKLKRFWDSLDEKSRKIFWHFKWHEHARLAELTELTGASNDMEVLTRIREIINPNWESIFGRPLIEFYKSKINRASGKKILFNWWLSDFDVENPPVLDKAEKPLVDIFDENDRIFIIAELPHSISVHTSAKIEERHGILRIWLKKI